MKKRNDGQLFYFLFCLPALILLLIFFVVPVVQSLILSVTDQYGLRQTHNFIGLANFFEAFTDKSFLRSIGATFQLTVLATVLGNILALTLALVLDSRLRFRNTLRAVFFIPNIMSLLIVGYIWRFVYTNGFVEIVRLFTGKTIALLGQPHMVIPAIAVVAVWNSAGYFMIIYIAALQSISEDIIEAARIDGASPAQTFFHVKLPMIFPTITTCLILSVAMHLKTFELPYTMTAGGPAGTSTTMVLKIYHTAFNANRTGYATAQSTILFLIIAGISWIIALYSKRKEKQYS